MAWVIVLFSDQTVSSVSVKWLRKKGKKCYFPKKKILMKIKKEAKVNKKSDKWCLHSCRILMNGSKNLRFFLVSSFSFHTFYRKICNIQTSPSSRNNRTKPFHNG